MTPFGTTAEGREVHKITLSAGDLSISLLTWGAVLQDVRLRGVDHPLTLGSDLLSDYEGEMRHHGSLIGPIVNRISNARIRIEGMMFELERNQDGRIHLHSGAQASHLQVWDVVQTTTDSATLQLSLPDGMCGLPGNRLITANYAVSAPGILTLTVTGETDARTPMNFANHSYWNLNGGTTFDGHTLQIAADRFLPGNADNYPTGEVADVAGTDMDFRRHRTVAVNAPPFDNNFCVSDTRGPLREVLELRGSNGTTMRMATTEPGVQIYDARDARRPGRGPYEGLAIEVQGWPDAPNNPGFPSIMVDAGETYRQITRWSFSAT
jgi:aldose 1-epimerase